VPGKHHGNLVDAKMRQRIGSEMAAASRTGLRLDTKE
jgi:hypothetical protein